MNKPLEIEFKAPSVTALPEYITSTQIPGLYLVERPVYSDNRGDFWEIARIPDLELATERPINIKQINRSRNTGRGTLRGIHVADWDKLITVIRGTVFIALIDLRKNSPTFGNVFTKKIGDNERSASVFIPAGFGNSYQTLTDITDYVYAVTDLWRPGREIGIAWNDPDLAIEWPVHPSIVSDKDAHNPQITQYIPDFSKLAKK